MKFVDHHYGVVRTFEVDCLLKEGKYEIAGSQFIMAVVVQVPSSLLSHLLTLEIQMTLSIVMSSMRHGLIASKKAMMRCLPDGVHIRP